MPPTPIWTIGSLLTWTTDFFTQRHIDEPRLSAELLLAHALHCSRMALYTQFDRIPPDDQLASFRTLVKQRANHVPVAYLIGKAWFFSLEFTVSPAVLIPRPDTETLVEFAIQQLRQHPEWSEPGTGGGVGGGGGGPGPALLDLCTGSGIIPITLAKHFPTLTATATDISPSALTIAKQNAADHKVADRLTFLEGDLFAPLDSMPAPTLFHLITANPPYIPSADIQNLPPTIKDHEPLLALDGGPDGLALHRQILASAPLHLHPNGLLILEIQFDQSPTLTSLITQNPAYSPPRTIRDAAGHPRCLTTSKLP